MQAYRQGHTGGACRLPRVLLPACGWLSDLPVEGPLRRRQNGAATFANCHSLLSGGAFGGGALPAPTSTPLTAFPPRCLRSPKLIASSLAQGGKRESTGGGEGLPSRFTAWQDVVSAPAVVCGLCQKRIGQVWACDCHRTLVQLCACPGTWSFRINLIENLIFSLAPSDGPIMS